MSINILQELNELKVPFEFSGEEYVKTLCVFHEESNSSLSISVKDGHFRCFSCGAAGRFVQLVAGLIKKHTGEDVPLDKLSRQYADKYGLHEDVAAIEPQLVDEYAARLKNAKPLLDELAKRGVSYELARAYRFGEHRGRITIPVENSRGDVVNIQHYAPGATRAKFVNSKGRGQPRLYPFSQLSYDKIVLTGGPIKAVCGAAHFNELGYGCLTVIAGEGVLTRDICEQLKNKTVYVCFDSDKAGVRAAKKTALQLYSYVEAVYVCNLNFGNRAQDYPKGGLDDYLAIGLGAKELLETALPITPDKNEEETNAAPIEVSISEAYDADVTGRQVELSAQVSAVSETPYTLPQIIEIKCGKDAKPDGICSLCPVATAKLGEDEVFTHEIKEGSRAFLAMLGQPDKMQKNAIARDCRIPPSCNVHTQKIKAYTTVEDIRISPILDLSRITKERDFQPAISTGLNLEANLSYQFKGKMFPHPMTQVSTLVLYDAEPIKDSIDTWSLEDPERMESLRAKDGVEDIEAKLTEICDYLAADVTHIYNRELMHLVWDLTLHSVLRIAPFGREERGYMESLIAGDSSCGKSETSKRLLDLYGVGEIVDGKHATVAGLIGGNEQIANSRHMVMWGALPRNDRGCVLIEELSGTAPETFGKLTEVRSEGIARIAKIASKVAMSRVRLLICSNARKNRIVSSYSYGTDLIGELIGAAQDIRRLDLAMVVDKRDRDITPIEATTRFDQKVLRDCLMFAWTRTSDQIIYDDPEHIKQVAKRVCDKYDEGKVPLVDSGSMRSKLARLATAIAARTWSVEGDILRVTKNHVLVAERFLYRLYDDKATGYLDYSKMIKQAENLRNPDEVTSALRKIRYANVMVENLLQEGMFENEDLAFWAGMDKDELQEFISCLVRNRAIVRKGRGAYVKTVGFVHYLRHLDVDDLRSVANGNYAGEKF